MVRRLVDWSRVSKGDVIGDEVREVTGIIL